MKDNSASLMAKKRWKKTTKKERSAHAQKMAEARWSQRDKSLET